jgi:D-serine deaminase-like pyridoxal phosphate-dependent protein
MATDEIRELLKSLMDVREWLARLDEKLERVSDVKYTADQALKVADEADKKSDRAIAMSEENARDIAELKAESARNRQILYGALATVVAGVLVYFLTN